jgi:hypothetical protein
VRPKRFLAEIAQQLLSLIADFSIADSSIADSSIADFSIADSLITDFSRANRNLRQKTPAYLKLYEKNVLENPNKQTHNMTGNFQEV